jgi:hypothetical protein
MEQTVQSTKQTNYVACLKWGDKYSPEYVNNLYNMVQRNLSLRHEFVCFTENSKGLNPDIKVHPLPNLRTTGWWYKPYFLSGKLPLKPGTLLFLDLDLIVFKNIDKLFKYEPGKFCIIRDFNRKFRPSWNRMNSSVFRVDIGTYNHVWQEFKDNHSLHQRSNHGDQDFLFKQINDHVFWPDEWIQSYKWEMRGRNELQYMNRRRDFKSPKDPTVLEDTSIAVFHGQPDIHDTIDTWPRLHWR